MLAVEKILAESELLPALPGVVSQVLEITRDPEFAMDALIRVVENDPGVTSSVIRRCNSPYFGLRQKVTSLARAVPHIGTKNLVEITLASGVSSFFRGEHSGYLLTRGQLWRHSITAALISRRLAEKMNHPDPPTLHTAALLHDVGKLVLAGYVREQFKEVGRLVLVEGMELIEAERRVLGIDHAELGARVAERWDLSETIATAIRYHHEPGKAPAPRGITNLVALANYFANLLGEPEKLNQGPPTPPTSVIIELKLGPKTVREMAHDLHGMLEGAEDLLALAD